MRFKIVINPVGKIFLIYCDPLKTKKVKPCDIQKYDTQDEARINSIKLRVGVMTRTFIEFFKDDSLMPILGNTMLLKNRVKNEVITIRYEQDMGNPGDHN